MPRPIALLTQALALEPDNALLLAHAAWALSHRNAMGWPPIGPDDGRPAPTSRAAPCSARPGIPTVMAHCGLNLLQTGRTTTWGMAVLNSAAKANPNNHMVVVVRRDRASALRHRSRTRWPIFHRAIRLSPNDPVAHVPLTGIAHCHIVRGDYAEAFAWAVRSLALNTKFDPTYWMLIAANAHLGRLAEARRFLQELRALAPGGHGGEHQGRAAGQGPEPPRRHPGGLAARRAA